MASSDDDTVFSFFLFLGGILSLGCLFWVWRVIANIAVEYGITFVFSACIVGTIVAIVMPALLRLPPRLTTARLESTLSCFNEKYKHSPCQVQSLFGRIEKIRLTSKGGLKLLAIDWLPVECISSGQSQVKTFEIKWDNSLWIGSLDYSRMLKANSIHLFDPLSVEYKAIKLAFDCQREIQWITKSKDKLFCLRSDLQKTMRKAHGNRLLSSSFEKIQNADNAFAIEEARLSEALTKAVKMTNDIIDFLGIPEQARAVIGLSINEEEYISEFSQLEESFEELVLITEALQRIS